MPTKETEATPKVSASTATIDAVETLLKRDIPSYAYSHLLGGTTRADAVILADAAVRTQQATRVDWWITSGPLDGTGGRPRGQKILGPFVSQDLAIKVRAYVEEDSNGCTFWICPEATHA